MSQFGENDEGVRATATQAISDATDKAQQTGQQAAERVREQVDGRSTTAGEQVSSIADVARRMGDELRGESKDREAKLVDGAADRMERLGGYLRDGDADRFLADVEDFGRRQPMALAAGGVVVGLLAARFLKASSSRRDNDSSGEYRGQRQLAPYGQTGNGMSGYASGSSEYPAGQA